MQTITVDGAVCTTLPVPSRIAKVLAEADATLGTSAVRESVKLPRHVEENEWIAAKMVEVYQETVSVVKVLRGICKCEGMKAGDVTVAWRRRDTEPPEAVSANEYMRHFEKAAYELLTDRTLIPVDDSLSYPENFVEEMSRICRWVMRIYNHVYMEHLDDFKVQGCTAHLNCCFKRFLFLAIEYRLLSEKDYLKLKPLVLRYLDEDGQELDEPAPKDHKALEPNPASVCA
mmetsp:Transcript_2622/g.6748  ORF Transcript_2622/g.6748 Transcript_2622/m.6748 type:complete len:230 (+) Transcript_2622:72-761(+)